MTDGINITQCSQPWWQTVGISLLFDIDGDNLTKMKTEEYDELYLSSSLMMTYMMTSESTINHGNLVVCGLRPNGALQTVAMQIIILMTIMAGIIIIIMMTMMMMMSQKVARLGEIMPNRSNDIDQL